MTFQSLLPTSSGLFEKAIEEVFGTALDAIEPELIKAFWNPDTCPAEHLSVLAHALSVDLWDDSWDVLKKRSVIRRWVGLEFAKGTYQAYHDFIEIAGGELKQTLVPPGGFFLAPAPTQAEWEAYIDANPRVRIQLARRTANEEFGLFLAEDYLDDAFLTPDFGEQLYGRRATFRMTVDSPDIDLQLITVRTWDETRNGVDFEQLVLPAEMPLALYLDDGYVDDGFLDAQETAARYYSFRLDREYQHRVSEAWLNVLAPGFEPRDPTYYRVSDIGVADDCGIYLDWSCLDDDFLVPDRGDEMLADVLYLHNPDVKLPETGDAGFLDDSFLDFPRFRAEMRIDAHEFAEPDAFFLNSGYVGEAFMLPEDPKRRDAIFRAVNAARAKRDQVMVTFQNTRPRTLADGFRLGDGIQLGKPVPYFL